MRLSPLLAILISVIAVAASENGTKKEEKITSMARANKEVLNHVEGVPMKKNNEDLRLPFNINRRISRPRSSSRRPYSKITRKRRPIHINGRVTRPRPRYHPKNYKTYTHNSKKFKRGHPKKVSFGKYHNHYPKRSRRPHGKNRQKPYSSFIPQEPAGFGEPPSHEIIQQQSYAEPPIDSYGNSISHFSTLKKRPFRDESNGDDFPPNYVENTPGAFPPYDNEGYGSNKNYKFRPDHSLEADYGNHKPVTVPFNIDTSAVDSYKMPPLGSIDNSGDSSQYDDLPKDKRYNLRTYMQNNKYKPIPVRNKERFNNKPLSGNKPKVAEDIIVGGQYAEPPARYAHRFKPTAYSGEESSLSQQSEPFDSEESASSYHSSYVNYKNSNMAFSPQNLNDAFSIAEH